MNEHPCAAPGCFVKVGELELACWPHLQLVPREIRQEITNALAHRRRTGSTFLLTRALAEGVRWLHENLENPNPGMGPGTEPEVAV